MGNIKNFKYLFAEKLKGMEVVPKINGTDPVTGQIVQHYELYCPVKRNFICSFDLVLDAPKKRGRPKKNS